MTVAVRQDRIMNRIHALAQIVDPAQPPYTRRAFTDVYLAGRRWLEEEFHRSGLDVALDAGANLIGRLPGREPGLPPLVVGSHTDTVVGGGRFDGVAGVVAALEVVEVLREEGRQLRHPLEVVDFLSEEPSDYGVSCVGSRAMAGALTPAMLAAVNSAGEPLREAIRRMGGRPEELDRPLRQPGSVAAYLELHIEQGPVLESTGTDIGIVTDIVGILRYDVDIAGQPDHAGTTPMALRRDALVGAARLIDAAYRRARAWPRPLVATVGWLQVSPNATNVVPGRVRLTLEVRSGDAADMAAFAEELLTEARQWAAELKLDLSYHSVTDSPPTPCHPAVRAAIKLACSQTGRTFLELSSGAGHDAAYMARLGPTGMLFIPCRGGRSHCPEEWAEPDHLAAGAAVLYQALVRLDETL